MKAVPPINPLDRLAAYRLRADLTFEALAAEMTAAGWPMTARGVHWALTARARLRTRPRERTLYKIEQFVATLDAPAPARKRSTKVRRKPAA